MDERDQFFNNVFDESSGNAETARFQRQLGFEERTIKRVFSECGIKVGSWGKLVNECRNQTGLHRLNFNWFNRRFGFPARLCGRRIAGLYDLVFQDFFKPATRNRMFKSLHKNLHRQEIDTDRPFLFVFPIVGTMFCAHNLDIGRESDSVTLSMRQADTLLVFETTKSFFSNLGAEWFQPDPE